MFNILNLAQGAFIANAATQAVGGLPLGTFSLEGWAIPATGKGGPGAGGHGSANPARLSAAEMISSLFGQNQHLGSMSFMESVRSNFTYVAPGSAMNNGTKLVLTAILTPALFKVGKKVLAKPLINPLNRGLKQVGLASTVKV